MVKETVFAGKINGGLSLPVKEAKEHFLPVYNKPMIYCLSIALMHIAATGVLRRSIEVFVRLAANETEFSFNSLTHVHQEKSSISEALLLAEHSTEGKPVCVALGRNSFEKAAESFEGSLACSLGRYPTLRASVSRSRRAAECP